MIQELTRTYQPGQPQWGHIGVKTWNRIPPKARKRITELRGKGKSFKVVIDHPSVATVTEIKP